MIDKVCFRSQQTIPEFLSTHPSDIARINQIEAWLPEALKYYHAAQNDEQPAPAPYHPTIGPELPSS
jgi:predicted Zn-dependent protease